MNIAAMVVRVKNVVFPSKHIRMVREWYANQGEDQLRLNYDLDNQSVVLDIGGFKGQWASDIFSMYGSYVYVFEPVRDFAEGLKNRFSRNKRIKVFPFGLGGKTRTEAICVSGDASSVCSTIGKSCRESVQIKDVLGWVNEEGVGDIALAKINIEGGEYELLDRMIETGLIGRIKDVQIQFHKIKKKSAQEMARIQSELSKTHKLTYQYEFVWENWTRLETMKSVCCD
ncbi:MAG: FkbM family methyltransferase [Kiritimatiellales bacterium]